MKKQFILSCFFVISIVISCKFNADDKKLTDDSWQTIYIVDDHYFEYTITNGSDSSLIRTFHGGGFFSKDKTVTVDSTYTRFTHAEKDTLHQVIQDIISHPVNPKKFCTEYIGGLEVGIIISQQVSQKIRYSSTCDWSALSDKTKQLSLILKRHLKSN